ncbi:thioredoxin fold domain-containing protein, partial [Klebsiella pneumoniae]|nr:thioredoxin fold domain-containing protein [Klebsiella pneumoniae]
YVFTDADCGYCRKFHSEIDEMNALGIEVRYLPWPRNEQTMPIMEKIWCSSDRKKALTDAKLGMPINAPTCSNPVRKI